MARNMQILHQPRKQATRKTIQDTTTKYRKTPHAYTQGRRNSAQPSQSHYYSHFYFNKQAYAQYELAQQKEQIMPRATL